MLQVRQEKLRKFIDKKKIVTIRELRELLPDVSVMTIHRDLNALADAGIIEKVRGGARSVRQEGDPVYDVRMRENT
ncbi:MAG: DeoR/GlpR transcriptional regulator, partial [Lachnospiraceae bacterium]|nr:DeoR/GlpR transcriptional regulator [Lachnospiraceae bacterium]